MNNIKWEKILVSVGMGIAGYHAITMQMTTWPQLPYVNNMVLMISGFAALYAIYVLNHKY